MIALETRVTRLERRDPRHGDRFAHLSDDELEAQIAAIEDTIAARVESGEDDVNSIPAQQWEEIMANVSARRAGRSNPGESLR